MKKKLFVFIVFLTVVLLVGCNVKSTPSIKLENNAITLYVGNSLDLMAGVKATDENGKDVTSSLKIEHNIPINEEGVLTTAGTYSVTYSIIMDGKDYLKTLTVTIISKVNLNITNKEINIFVGDELNLMDGVSATGVNNENLTELIEVNHDIELDENNKVTKQGVYNVIYQIKIDNVVYQESAVVNVSLKETNTIINGDFETGEVMPFVKNDFEGSDSNISVVNIEGNNVLKLDIDAVSWGSASPRVEYNNLVLSADKIYELSFEAYADDARAMHLQVGELLTVGPWYKAAYAQTRYFDLTTEKQIYSWRFQPSSDFAGADINNLSLLFEFGNYENRVNVATNIYMDNIKLEVVDELEVDVTAPVLKLNEPKEYYFLNDYFNNILSNVSYLDENGEQLEIFIDEENSNMPSINDEGRITTFGNYSIIFYAVDKAGNRGTIEWLFEVKDAYPVTNGFNLIDFKSGTAGDIQEGITQYGYVYAENPDTTFEYQAGILRIKSTQSKTENGWTATQIFARSVRQEGFSGEGAKKFTLSFDITSDVEGYIQVNELPYKIIVGTTKIAIEGNIFNYNYKNLTIVLGVHKSLLSIEQNIGACEIAISNISFVRTHELADDVIPPVIKLNGNKTYFVGDDFDLMSTVSISDFRGSVGATLEIDRNNSDIIPINNGKVTEAGVYHVTFIATDASNNKSSYEFVYNIREQLPNSNGFSIEKIEFGEEGTLDDPSVVYLWNDSGVNVTSQVIDRNNFKITSNQSVGNNVPWYSTQIFFKSLTVDKWALYELSFEFVSNVAGHVTIFNEGMEIQVGTNIITKKIAIQAGDFQKITMQLGRNGYGTIGPCEIEIRNLSLIEVVLPEGNYWEGYGMDVVNSETENVITYENIPTDWSTHNARIYIFNTTATFQALVIEFIGTAGQRYQFKFEGTSPVNFNATSITATGELQRVIIDTRNRTEAQRLSMYNLLMFVENVGVSGTATIKGYTLYENFNDAFSTNWFSLSDMVVSDEEDGSSTITYSNIPTNWWEANAQHTMKDAFTENAQSITFTFKGVAGHTYLFKIEGGGYSKEMAVVATGENQDFILDISSLGANTAKLSLAVVFCQTTGATGAITIYKVTINQSE